MGDEGMDPCECIWSHELSMRRLLSLLRQSQAYCTETECIDVSTPPNGNQDPNSVLFMSLIFVFALFMYYLRPRGNRVETLTKPSINGNDSQGAPPPPPATS